MKDEGKTGNFFRSSKFNYKQKDVIYVFLQGDGIFYWGIKM